MHDTDHKTSQLRIVISFSCYTPPTTASSYMYFPFDLPPTTGFKSFSYCILHQPLLPTSLPYKYLPLTTGFLAFLPFHPPPASTCSPGNASQVVFHNVVLADLLGSGGLQVTVSSRIDPFPPTPLPPLGLEPTTYTSDVLYSGSVSA
jgi:hypothetical protein